MSGTRPRAASASSTRRGTVRVCGFDFSLVYRDIGTDYIHVHHLRLLASIGAEYEVDPIVDLRPVCPNCHAMLHRENPPITIEALRERVKSSRADAPADQPVLEPRDSGIAVRTTRMIGRSGTGR